MTVFGNWTNTRTNRHESDPMLNSVLNGDCSNSVPGRQFTKGLWKLTSINRVTTVSIQDEVEHVITFAAILPIPVAL